jgi:hypothetical protein
MSVSIEFEGDGSRAYYDADLENDLQALLCRFADWIYEQLEAENDYLHSDEYVDERLADDEFDEDGVLV